jgi:hypothetical protein
MLSNTRILLVLGAGLAVTSGLWAQPAFVPPWVGPDPQTINPMVTCVLLRRTPGTSGFEQGHWQYVEQHGPALPGAMFNPDPAASGFTVTDDGQLTNFSIRLPNFIDNLPVKLFYVEFDCVSQVTPPIAPGTGIVLNWVDTNPPQSGTVPASELSLVGDGDRFRSRGSNGSPWWVFQPNPDAETLTFSTPHSSLGGNESSLQNIFLYTISVPAPGAVALAMGGVGLMVRRRR